MSSSQFYYTAFEHYLYKLFDHMKIKGSSEHFVGMDSSTGELCVVTMAVDDKYCVHYKITGSYFGYIFTAIEFTPLQDILILGDL